MQVFVYGTLRAGGRYWPHALGSCVDAVSPTVTMPGLDLFEGPGYPLAATSPDGCGTGVVGEVVTIATPWVGVVLAELDRIEGHPGLFLRVERDGVWTYVATPSTLLDVAGPQIPSGDWFAVDTEACRAWSTELGRTYIGSTSMFPPQHIPTRPTL